MNDFYFEKTNMYDNGTRVKLNSVEDDVVNAVLKLSQDGADVKKCLRLYKILTENEYASRRCHPDELLTDMFRIVFRSFKLEDVKELQRYYNSVGSGFNIFKYMGLQ